MVNALKTKTVVKAKETKAKEAKAAPDFTVTEKAAKKMLELAKQDKKEGYGLKLNVMPGGCSGFQYGMDFEKKASSTDIVTKQHGLTVFIDKDSLDFLKGATIDYVDSLNGSGFKIDNPNVEHTCGCGKSVC
jgi:iron-sulfur cluster assembly protein